MRWDDLFTDLEAQAEDQIGRERAVEAHELTRAEVSRIDLASRLLPGVGTLLTVRSLGGVRTAGTLARVGPDWLLLDEGQGREVLLALHPILGISGVGRWSATPPPAPTIESRLGIGSVLRGVARDRSPVRAHLVDGSVIDGTVDRVGADFVELAVHGAGEVRRHQEVREVQVIPHRALSALRRDV